MKLKLKWSVAVAMYEKQYEHYCKTAQELTELFAQHGIATTVLKGIGMSTLYPKPAHREGGDIDIYTYSADRSKMSDQQANRLADDLMRQQGIDVDLSHNPKHSILTYNGVTIENHNAIVSARDLPLVDKLHEALHRCSLQEKAEIPLPLLQPAAQHLLAHPRRPSAEIPVRPAAAHGPGRTDQTASGNEMMKCLQDSTEIYFENISF